MFTKEEVGRIREGATYVYTAELPAECEGHHYRVVKFVKDVPSYQDKVLVECLTGPDRGLWFVVSYMNFARRYRPVGTD